MKVLTRAQLDKWLDGLAPKLTLVAPVESEGKLSYRAVQGSADIAWGFQRTDMSPKTWVFPATEPILNFHEAERARIMPAPDPAPTVVFGVRPCDARAFLAIDALFLDKEPRDGRFAAHREATTLVGLACPQMWESCFCTVVGGAPDGAQGLDMLLTEVDRGFAMRALSDKGTALAADLPGEDQDVRLPVPKRTEGLPALRPAAEWYARFGELFWQRLGDRCLGCRTCTFVCPACRCFDVRDEVASNGPTGRVVQRLRAWDACTISGYRRIAGGHNPRPTQAARLKNRFYCKFAYYPQDFGALGCVGCGRCIAACPVGIDICEVVAEVERMPAKEPR